MNKTGKTVYIFGIYLVLFGATLIFIPNIIFNFVGIPSTKEVWIRVVGVLVGILGFLNIQCARKNIEQYFILTVYTRGAVFLFFTSFVLLGFVKSVFLLVGLVDLLGAIWTLKEIKNKQ